MNIMLKDLNQIINITINNTINGTITLNNSKKVNDAVRGYLTYNGSWCFTRVINKKIHTVKKIALILESPHKDEYTITYIPIGPANGRTGTNIDNKIIKRTALTNSLNNNYAYEVNIMNPVQFQCSCYNELNGLVQHPKTNLIKQSSLWKRNMTTKVFRRLYKYSDFKNRLYSYKPDIVFNCCASSLKPLIKTLLKYSFNNVTQINDVHPSVW